MIVLRVLLQEIVASAFVSGGWAADFRFSAVPLPCIRVDSAKISA